MSWFFIALINPIAHAFVNHFDKYLLSKYVKNGTVGALLLFSALFSAVILPVMYFLSPSSVFDVTLSQGLLLILNGGILVLAVMFYLYGLHTDETSYVVPLMQVYPVFGFLFGYWFLGETITLNQILGGTLIVVGGAWLALDLSQSKWSVKYRTVGLMFLSSALYSINAVIFKSIAVEQGYIGSLFWDMAGKVLLGLILFWLVRSYRRDFISMIKENGKKVMGLNSLNEFFGVIGEASLVLAILYAPVVLVQSISGLQPIFVLIFGVIGTWLFPKIITESMGTKFLIQKISGVVIMSAGLYFMEIFK